MAVAMVQVRVVRVGMGHSPMRMEVAVGFLPVPVLVVFVVAVSMIVPKRLVPVLMRMSLSEVQPHATSHQRRSDHEVDCQTITENEYGEGRPNKRSRRKIRPRPRGS